MKYTWSILLKKKDELGNIVVLFRCLGENYEGYSWEYFGSRVVESYSNEDIIKELDKEQEIKIRINKEVKKITNPENYGFTD